MSDEEYAGWKIYFKHETFTHRLLDENIRLLSYIQFSKSTSGRADKDMFFPKYKWLSDKEIQDLEENPILFYDHDLKDLEKLSKKWNKNNT